MGNRGARVKDLISEAWYQRPLFVAIVAIALTLVTTQAGGYLQSCAAARRMDIALKLAFSGEVYAIRGALEYTARNASEAFRQGKMLKKHQIVFPARIFEANASSLGNIKDRELIKQLSTLYSLLDRTNELARRIDDGVYDAGSFLNYLRNLLICWQFAINLDMRLQMETKDHTDLDWQVVLTKKDADDKNLANKVLQDLNKLEPETLEP